MAEITMKSTKAEIMEAYKAAVEKLDTRDRMIDDPAKEAAKAKKVEVIESADKTAKEDIFNPEIIKKYNDLTEAIEIKQLELDELYGIETKANAMAAMINAYKEKNEELKEAQAAIQKKVNAQQELELANIEAKTAKVQADKDKEVALIAAEQDKEKAAIEAEQAKITAEGKAEATRIKADAEAEANKKIAESLTPELIEKQKIDKWNGDVPKVQGGNAATIVDAGELTSGNVATVENK